MKTNNYKTNDNDLSLPFKTIFDVSKLFPAVHYSGWQGCFNAVAAKLTKKLFWVVLPDVVCMISSP